jgi:hypothetical protein
MMPPTTSRRIREFNRGQGRESVLAIIEMALELLSQADDEQQESSKNSPSFNGHGSSNGSFNGNDSFNGNGSFNGDDSFSSQD